MDQLEAVVDATLFRNDQNGYSVIRATAGRSHCFVVGTFPELVAGEQAIFTGEWTEHPRYGKQFRAEAIQILKPTSVLGIRRFLSSGLIRGIGPKAARQIVEAFGEDTLEVLSEHPERLLELKGFGKARVKMITESFQQQLYIRESMVYLQSLGIQPAMAAKISQFYGEATRTSIQTNPYCLCTDIENFGFPAADRIAATLGFPKDAPQRLQSALVYTLMNAAVSSGHCYLPAQLLLQEASRLTQVSQELIRVQMQSLVLSRRLIQESDDEETRVYLPEYYLAEEEVCDRLRLLVEQAPRSNRALKQKALEQFERTEQIRFSPLQRDAILCALELGTLIITGGPGTGKTTIINCIITLLSHKGGVMLCAPTGRAAKRMTEATGVEAKTIHRLLEYNGEENAFLHDDGSPLKASCIICDETSMVDLMLMRALLRAIRPGTRLILVGDADQLPSVGAGNVLGDLLRSSVIPSVRLTDIFRQQAESQIVINAHRINHGEMPVLNARQSDFFFERQLSASACAQSIVRLVQQRLPDFMHYTDAERLRSIQVLAPQKNGDTGVHTLNTLLQNALNPPDGQPSLTWSDTVFREGDKVMQTRNNYLLEWVREDETGTGIFNGDLGIIEEIDEQENTLTVRFDDDRTAVYTSAEMDNLDLAYCMSVHKAQGSEFPVLVMPVCACPYPLQTRNLFYTALTRAQKLVVLVGDEAIIAHMVQNDHVSHRYTTLAERLYQALSQSYSG